MGIGNPRPAGSPTPRAHTHYPSWGLETRLRFLSIYIIFCLITPHGDWKPAAGVCPAAGLAMSSSLPLMGIGNQNVVVSAYNHGSCSLPLMGIGNLALGGSCGTARTGSLPLMGIGNPPSTTTRARRSQAHYPSWGLETCTLSASQALPYTLASLPLMGIGNRSDDLAGGEGRVAHYPSWGLETGCGPWGMG